MLSVKKRKIITDLFYYNTGLIEDIIEEIGYGELDDDLFESALNSLDNKHSVKCINYLNVNGQKELLRNILEKSYSDNYFNKYYLISRYREYKMFVNHYNRSEENRINDLMSIGYYYGRLELTIDLFRFYEKNTFDIDFLLITLYGIDYYNKHKDTISGLNLSTNLPTLRNLIINTANRFHESGEIDKEGLLEYINGEMKEYFEALFRIFNERNIMVDDDLYLFLYKANYSKIRNFIHLIDKGEIEIYSHILDEYEDYLPTKIMIY
ncbi:hypothetical protein [Staphylococcus phage vB_StaM_SA1]|nr:hypothetical protein [Staphylococcus phage vB_StaM_SA1]